MKASLDDATNEFLWRAWTTLGVAGVVAPLNDILVDPEGLIVMTGVIGDDLRLRGEAIDWSSRYFSFVSTTRLRNLSRALSEEERARLFVLTGQVNAVSSARWPGSPWPAEPPRVSGKSRLPALTSGALARLRYRAIFGTTSRAEILLYLNRADGWVSAAQVANATGYAKRIVATTLDELAQAEIVTTVERGNRTDYRLSARKRLDAFAGLVAKNDFEWVGWARLLAVCARTAPSKRTVARIELAKTLDETGLGRHVEPDVASIAAAFGKAIAVQGTSPNQSSAKVAPVP